MVRGSQKTGWEWSYSPFIGIMYGPLPVGLIVALIIVIIAIIYMNFD